MWKKVCADEEDREIGGIVKRSRWIKLLCNYSSGCIFSVQIQAEWNLDFKLNLTLQVNVNQPPKQQGFIQGVLHFSPILVVLALIGGDLCMDKRMWHGQAQYRVK